MMSLETIRSMSQEARERAAAEGMVPYLVDEKDISAWKRGSGLPLPFPFIGDYVPDGYEPEGEALFVDTSGFGAPDEPALTLTQFLDELEADKAYTKPMRLSRSVSFRLTFRSSQNRD
jgi:hypothetical protein